MLLRSARRDPAPIAILYSQPSIQANFILNREQRTQKVRNAWVNLLHDMGLQFDFVAYAQLATPGFLAEHGYRALILPEALALSEAEVAQTIAFAQAGGVVIADNSVGWMDEHCRTLKADRLDELVGLSAAHEPVGAAGLRYSLQQAWGLLQPGATIAGVAPAGKVTPAAARSVLSSGDPATGAIYVHPVGKGQAVYLNLCLVPFREERQMGGPGEMAFRQLIGGALGLAGIGPKTPIVPAGKQAFHGHVVHFTDQQTRYVGIIRDYETGAPDDAFTITLPEKLEVYDVRGGKHLGRTDRITAVLYAGAAKLYCLSPTPLPAPTLSLPPQAAIGKPVECRVGLAEPAQHNSVVRLEVRDTTGTLRSCYSGPHLLKPGVKEATASFIPALNDPTGEWQIKAVDIASGQTATGLVLLRDGA